MLGKRYTGKFANKVNRAFQGIYYVVRLPEKWELFVYRFAPGEDIGHAEWFEKTLARQIATAWAKTIGMNPQRIERRVKDLCYAFPRGRLTRVKNHVLIVHGDDITEEMGGEEMEDRIEGAFLIRGKFWKAFDDHERCQELEKNQVRELFGIPEDWPAV